MDKRIIRETSDDCWISKLDGATVADAILYLQTLSPNAQLEWNWTGYEACQGDIVTTRKETDEEYEGRLQLEKEVAAKAAVKAEKERKAAQENIDMTLKNLQKQMDSLRAVRPK